MLIFMAEPFILLPVRFRWIKVRLPKIRVLPQMVVEPCAENGSISITSSSFSANRSIFDGGAILAFDLSAVIEDSNFTANVNSVSNGGGAIHFSSVTVRSPVVDL